jgi:hypothetical protein
MLVALFGTPTDLTQWVLHLINSMLRIKYADAYVIPVVHTADLRREWSNRDGRATLIFSDIPELFMLELILRSGAPVVLCHDEMFEGVDYVMRSRNLNLRDAIRFMSQSYSTLEKAYLTPSAAIFGPSVRQTKLRRFVTDLAEACRIWLDAAQIDHMISLMTGGDPTGEGTVEDNIARHLVPAMTARRGALDPFERDLAARVLTPYAAITRGQRLMEVDWPPELFYDWDDLGRSWLDVPKDLTGPARILTAGHIMHLPVGWWRATIELEIAENLSGNIIETDFLLGDDSLGGVRSTLPAEGRFSFPIEFDVSDSFPAVQMRMVLKEGAIEGIMRLCSVRIARCAAPPGRAP